MRHLLGGIHDLADLRALVRVAGHTPCYQDLPSDAFEADQAVERVAFLGTRDGLEWLGVTSRQPVAVARRLVTEFQRCGRLTAILALDTTNRRLAATVSVDPRPVLTIDLAFPSETTLRALERLRDLPGGSMGAAALAEAFNAESVGRRFFLAFRNTLLAMTEALPDRIPPGDRHHLALLQLTRVLFLYFVQAKGWLDGRSRFLRQELDRVLGQRRPVQRALLHPLFFGTLNRPSHSRDVAARNFGRVPFLNGGLFNVHPLERETRAVLPDEAWRVAFDELFERFHFTPREGAPDEVAPDMLGRVFEGVMDSDERSASGTYYTPLGLVDALIEAGLTAHLATHLRCSEAEAERRLRDPDPETRHILSSVTMLDPAVGSGAFLLSALVRLSAVAGGADFESRREVLSRNLFGVDLNAAAVRLAELRLWLALIEADPSDRPERVDPLPNLDGIVRQGDSLFDPIPAGWYPLPTNSRGAEAKLARSRVQWATGGEKRAAIRDLRKREVALFEQMLSGAVTSARSRIRDLLGEARSRNLFGDRRGLDSTGRRRLADLQARRRFLLRQKRRLVREGALPWFHFPSQFAEIFAERGGFDLVVGNPPWIRAEQVPAEARGHLQGRYEWWRTAPSASGYAHLPDLSVAFLERSMELCAPSGTIAMLVPAKLSTAAYASRARHGLATRTILHAVADLSDDPRASFDATTYPMALVCTKGAPRDGHTVRSHLRRVTPQDVPQARLGQGPWVLASDELAMVARRLPTVHPSLDSHVTCRLGVKTGLNAVFLDPPEPLEPELLCWALGGRDVGPFRAVPTRRMLWTHDSNGEPLPSLPPLATRYLARHEARLRARRDLRGDPPWQVFRVAGAVAPHRVVWADIAKRLEAAALNGPNRECVIPLNTCYVIAAPSRRASLALTAWLNSTWLRALAALAADPASNRYRRFNARVVSSLPLPPAVLDDARLAALGEQGARGELRQTELDDACNVHLALVTGERGALASALARGQSPAD